MIVPLLVPTPVLASIVTGNLNEKLGLLNKVIFGSGVTPVPSKIFFLSVVLVVLK